MFVLEHADTLVEAAANKLLKTLEEPPPYAHLILLTDRPGEVLPTIVSRCQLVRFDPLPPDEIAARLGAPRHGARGRRGVRAAGARRRRRGARARARRRPGAARGGRGAGPRGARRPRRRATAWSALLAAARGARRPRAATSSTRGPRTSKELAAAKDRERIDTLYAERAQAGQAPRAQTGCARPRARSSSGSGTATSSPWSAARPSSSTTPTAPSALGSRTPPAARPSRCAGPSSSSTTRARASPSTRPPRSACEALAYRLEEAVA